MDDLLKYVESWRSLVLVLVVFGFAPGFCLRLIVLAYPSDDPRRAELIAELYAVPRIKRPPWVAEQLEVALFEGLGHRISSVIRRRAAQSQTGKTRDRSVVVALLLLLPVVSTGAVLVVARPDWSQTVFNGALVSVALLTTLISWLLWRRSLTR